MNAEIIITQLIIVGIGIYLAFTESKKRIYLVTFLFNLTTTILYVIKGDTTTYLACIILTVRAFVFIYKDRLISRFGKSACIIPIFFIVLQLGAGLYTIENPWQLLTILAPAITCAYMWWEHGTQDIRGGNFLTYGMWATYELISGLYIIMISDIINSLFFGISLLLHKSSKQ